MSVIVHIDVFDGVPDPDALGILSALRRAGAQPAAVVCGYSLGSAVDVVAQHGPSRLFIVDHPTLAIPVATPRVAIARLMIDAEPAGRWLAPTNTLTVEIAGALAGAGHGVAWGLTRFDADSSELTATRLTGNDTIEATVRWNTAWGVGLFRSRAFDPEPLTDPVAIDPIELRLPDLDAPPIEIVETPSASEAGTDLASASVIVAAGRGIGEPSRLLLIRQLADRLGGVAGVSLPLVEMGWAPRSMQVGQTGTIVAPLLYIACGISGQIQHRVGMERSGTIIAINTDPQAPIMQFCDLAVVADTATVVPRLLELLGEGAPPT